MKKNNTLALLFIFVVFSSFQTIGNFGGFSIDEKLFNFILEILPKGSTVLELGSGWASGELSKYYTVYSIEHDEKWLNKFTSNYIYAPIVDNWYNVSILEKELPKKYDLILVDGPPGIIGREGFYKNLYLFDSNVPIIFDDINRSEEYTLMQNVAQELDRKPIIYSASKKKFGVILSKK